MALDTFKEIVGKVQLYVPQASSLLAREWVKNAFREVAERRTWSWLRKRSHFTMFDAYSTGTASTTYDSTTVTGSGTTWTSAMVGRQFRIGTSGPLYTITAFTSTTEVTIDPAWGEAAVTDQSYEIFNAYVTAPSDFLSFVSVWDPNYSWQLHLHLPQELLNSVDAQRTNSGTAYVVADLDYDTINSPPRPRYEVWPHQKSAYIYPYLYVSRATDLEDSGAVLPSLIRGDVLLLGSLREAAAYPGTHEKPNKFSNEYRLKYYAGRFEDEVMRLEKQDDEIFEQDVMYSTLPYAPSPFLDADYLQDHDL